jgi:hypothetical protein
MGRYLQVLLKNRFSESFLNKVLRLILNNTDKVNYRNRILPQDTAVCSYRINLHSPPSIQHFLEYKKNLDSKFGGKPYTIMLILLQAAGAAKNQKIYIEPEVLFRFTESLIECIKSGVQIVKFEISEIQNKGRLELISPENLIHSMITEVIHEICPSVLIITDMKQIQDDRLTVAELNKFLSRNR